MASQRFDQIKLVRAAGVRGWATVSDWTARVRQREAVACESWARKQWQALRDSHWWRDLLLLIAEHWRLPAGAVAVLLPILLLSFVDADLPVTAPGAVLMLAIAFAAYLADLAGGIVALVLATLLLDLRYIGDRSLLSRPRDIEEAIAFAVTILCGAALVWLVVRVKREGDRDRVAAVAARAAATALTSLDAVSIGRAGADIADPDRLLDSILLAMVRLHRAHGGSLLLVDSTETTLSPAASYGHVAADDVPADVAIGDGFVGQVALERRPLLVQDLTQDARFFDDPLAKAGIRAVLGVPLIDGDERLLGVAHIDLLMPYRFSATDVAKLEALAARAVALLQAARATDEREGMLARSREHQRRLRLVIDAMPEAVVIATPPDGRIVAYNEAAERLLGPLGDDAHARHVSGCLVRPDGVAARPEELPIAAALTTSEVATGVELIVRRPNLSDVPVLVSAAPLPEPDGSIGAVVGVFRDISALKAADRVQAEFVSIVSHELRSPLTPIRGFVQLVAKELEREGGHATQAERLHSVEGHVDRMTRLVDDLLDVSRLRAGRLDIKTRATDLAALCREVAAARGAAAPLHRLVLNLPPAPLVGNWDPDRLHQVIDNLVGNAIKYSPAGGDVAITLASDPAARTVRLDVADSGPGIAPEDQEQVFSAFYRSRDASASRIVGLGLGLFICRELVAAHNGAIEVFNGRERGAVFRVCLPWMPAQDERLPIPA